MIDRGEWAVARQWAAKDLRGRWRSIGAAGLIAGVAAGLTLASFAGARATGSALDRLRATTNSSDAAVFASQVNARHVDWTTLAARPEVRSLSRWELVYGNLGGEDGALFVPGDEQWTQIVDRPVVVEGRMPDPTQPDEVVVSEGGASEAHVGDTFPVTLYADADQDGLEDDYDGPDMTVHVVGIVRSPLDHLFVPLIIGSPALLTTYPEATYSENAFVQLDDPSHAAQLQAHADTDVAPRTPILDFSLTARRVRATTDVERIALLVLGVAIALAGSVLAGQLLSRSAASIGADANVLGALGMRRRALIAASVLAHVPAVVMATITSLVVAVATSAWLPFGLAGRLDPEGGLDLDAPVVLGGIVLLAVLVTGGIAHASRASGGLRPDQGHGHAGLVDWVRHHSPPAVGIGTTWAVGRVVRGDLAVRPAPVRRRRRLARRRRRRHRRGLAHRRPRPSRARRRRVGCRRVLAGPGRVHESRFRSRPRRGGREH